MKRTIFISLYFLILSLTSIFGQTLLYQSNFVGGVTGAGFTPMYTTSSPTIGNFSINICGGSTIHKAYLLAGRQGVAGPLQVTLNGNNFTFDNTNQASNTFQSAFYGGNSGVHAIDITASINPSITTYNITIPAQPSGPADVYTDFYLWVAYDNALLQPIHAAIFLNDQDMGTNINYTFNLPAPMHVISNIGVALLNGYACGAGDGSTITVNATGLGSVYGPDANSTSSCGGPMGCFYYYNNTLYGLSDDNPNQTMNGPDALSNVNAIVTNNSSTFTMNLSHGNQDNSYWAVFITFGDTSSLSSSSITGTFTISPDTACAPATITFTNTTPSVTSIHWDFGDGGTDTTLAPTHTYNNTGTYTVTMIVVCTGGCVSGTDTVTQTVVVVPPPSLFIGNDTSLCSGLNVTLDAGNPGSVYAWSTGATTQTINVTTTGSYWVHVGGGACVAADTINVTFLPNPVVNLGADISVCAGVPVTLDAGNAGATYLWNTGATTQTISPTTNGTYWVVAALGTCIDSDTINITFNTIPVVNLGANLSLCNGQSVMLNAGNAGATYQWSDGSTTQVITVSTAGNYWVVVSNGTCTGTDTVSVVVNVAPTVNLGPDIKLCYGIDTVLYANNPGFSYLWSTGETTQKIAVTVSGNYWVKVSNNGCIGTDTALVSISKKLELDLGVDTFVCPGEPITLIAQRGYASYYWTPVGGGRYFVTIDNAGTYYCTAIDTNGCSVTNSILVREFCPSEMYIPTAFTPNRNNMNDYFMAYCEGAVEFHMYIFDRWGEMVFESTDISQGWDGTFNGNDAPQGSYVYRIDYKLYTYVELKKYSKYGVVNLIR